MPQTPRFRNAALIYNPLAGFARRGRGQRGIERAVELLQAHGIGVTLIPTPAPRSAIRLARQQVEAGADLIIACGGDGTVNEVVNGMAGSRVPLALLPAGTGNILAKEFGLPWDIWRAAEYIPRGVVRRIALGQAIPGNGSHAPRYFICVAGAGADANIVRHLDLSTKLRLGMLSYWLEAFRQLLRYDFPEFSVRLAPPGGGEPAETHTAALLIVSRTRHYGGPIELTRRASLFRDRFEACLFPRRFRLIYLLYFVALELGLLERFPEVRFFLTSEVAAQPLGRPIPVELDGELAGELPMSFAIVPEALSLLVPERMAAG